jgi:transposase
MEKIVIGVDIAKLKFDVALFRENKYKHKVFTNNEQGFAEFVSWFSGLIGDSKPLICMEATGAYSLSLADFLVSQGYQVSMVNPAQIKAFGSSELSRAKTDKADAKLIARYAQTMQPPLWTPPSPTIRTLQALIRRADDLVEMIQMEQNRLGTTTENTVRESIETIITTLEAQLKATRAAIKQLIKNDPDLKQRAKLLDSIKGIGDVSIALLLVLLDKHHNFTDAKQVVAFAGLAPRLRQSGQWRGTTHLSKTGDAHLRKTLYMPAMTAWTHNPVIRLFCERLKANGKNGKAIVCAAMRKLIHLAFAILKSGIPFDPDYANKKPLTCSQ